MVSFNKTVEMRTNEMEIVTCIFHRANKINEILR